MKRVLIGKLGTQWVLRVSAPGRDVTTENDPRYILFDSRYSFTGSVHAFGSVTTTTYSPYWWGYPGPFCYYGIVYFPDLGYAPLGLAVRIDDIYVYGFYPQRYVDGSDVRSAYEPRWITASNYIRVEGPTSGRAYHYYVFRVPI